MIKGGPSSMKLAAIAVGAGVAVGVASFLAVRFLPHPANLIGTLGGPWLATAFAVGALTRSRRPAVWAGALSMRRQYSPTTSHGRRSTRPHTADTSFGGKRFRTS